MNMQPRMPVPTEPIILRDRQERFCVLVVEGKTAREAYLIVYDRKMPGSRSASSSMDASASALLKVPKVQLRIAQLRAYEAAARRVSRQSLTEMLAATYRNATADKQHAAATQAVMGLAKIHGFLVDRHEVNAIIRRPSADANTPDEMSEQAWMEHHGLGGLIDHLDIEDAEIVEVEAPAPTEASDDPPPSRAPVIDTE